MPRRLYDSRTGVAFRLHIDHIDNPDGDVWAIRVFPHTNSRRTRYFTTRRVDLYVPIYTIYRRRRMQPRAYLSGFGRVQQVDEWRWKITAD